MNMGRVSCIEMVHLLGCAGNERTRGKLIHFEGRDTVPNFRHARCIPGEDDRPLQIAPMAATESERMIILSLIMLWDAAHFSASTAAWLSRRLMCPGLCQ